jgi:hypothetical protein
MTLALIRVFRLLLELGASLEPSSESLLLLRLLDGGTGMTLEDVDMGEAERGCRTFIGLKMVNSPPVALGVTSVVVSLIVSVLVLPPDGGWGGGIRVCCPIFFPNLVSRRF